MFLSFTSTETRKELKTIYKGFVEMMRAVCAPFHSLSIIPFKNSIQGTMIIGDYKKYAAGILIQLEKIENGEKYLDLSFTPINIVESLWDNDKRPLVEHLTGMINRAQEPFNIKYRAVNLRAPDIKIMPASARVDKEFGLQFYCKYQYSDFNADELLLNFLNVCKLGGKCSQIIEEKYIA